MKRCSIYNIYSHLFPNPFRRRLTRFFGEQVRVHPENCNTDEKKIPAKGEVRKKNFEHSRAGFQTSMARRLDIRKTLETELQPTT